MTIWFDLQLVLIGRLSLACCYQPPSIGVNLTFNILRLGSVVHLFDWKVRLWINCTFLVTILCDWFVFRFQSHPENPGIEFVDPARACPQGISNVLRPITGGFGWRLCPPAGLVKLVSANLLLHSAFESSALSQDVLGKPHPKKYRVYLGIAQIAIWPPLLRKSGHFVAQFFWRKLENSFNSHFDFWNEYFDTDY